HRRENPSERGGRDRRLPRRQQRARQRERQREHRVAEPDERQVRAEARKHHSSQWICPGCTPDTRYSSTSSVRGGRSTASSRARFPGSIVPKSASKPRARAPWRVALSSRADAGTDGASACSVATSANTLRSGVLARLSVPMATRTPDL